MIGFFGFLSFTSIYFSSVTPCSCQEISVLSMPLFRQLFNEEGLFILLKIYELPNPLHISEVKLRPFSSVASAGQTGMVFSLQSSFSQFHGIFQTVRDIFPGNRAAVMGWKNHFRPVCIPQQFFKAFYLQIQVCLLYTSEPFTLRLPIPSM